MDNYYKVLKIDNFSEKKQVRASYLSLIKEYHPDKFRGDKTFAEKRSAEINRAYGTLKKEIKKNLYDEKLKIELEKAKEKKEEEITKQEEVIETTLEKVTLVEGLWLSLILLFTGGIILLLIIAFMGAN
jgi:curved DNA-binding protein CbpA